VCAPLEGGAWDSAHSRRFAKAALDRVGAAFLLLVAAPWFAMIALAIACESPGPVLSRHRRIGLSGQEFDLLRFRTSVADRRGYTPLGRMLRRFSLDELPQLLNVLTGQMSLVGPRPLCPGQADELHSGEWGLQVKPGLTGLWHLGGTSRLDPDGPAGLAEYSQHWTVGLDMAIMWRSLRSSVRGNGAF
jgi:lipopolysaccharide/colanic/teichoic acid biosynthesis glycosyltransferase